MHTSTILGAEGFAAHLKAVCNAKNVQARLCVLDVRVGQDVLRHVDAE
jgi:hypothetical protein